MPLLIVYRPCGLNVCWRGAGHIWGMEGYNLLAAAAWVSRCCDASWLTPWLCALRSCLMGCGMHL